MPSDLKKFLYWEVEASQYVYNAKLILLVLPMSGSRCLMTPRMIYSKESLFDDSPYDLHIAKSRCLMTPRIIYSEESLCDDSPYDLQQGVAF